MLSKNVIEFHKNISIQIEKKISEDNKSDSTIREIYLLKNNDITHNNVFVSAILRFLNDTD